MTKKEILKIPRDRIEQGNPYKGGILQQAIGNGTTRLTGSTDQQNSCP